MAMIGCYSIQYGAPIVIVDYGQVFPVSQPQVPSAIGYHASMLTGGQCPEICPFQRYRPQGILVVVSDGLESEEFVGRRLMFG